MGGCRGEGMGMVWVDSARGAILTTHSTATKLFVTMEQVRERWARYTIPVCTLVLFTCLRIINITKHHGKALMKGSHGWS